MEGGVLAYLGALLVRPFIATPRRIDSPRDVSALPLPSFAQNRCPDRDLDREPDRGSIADRSGPALSITLPRSGTDSAASGTDRKAPEPVPEPLAPQAVKVLGVKDGVLRIGSDMTRPGPTSLLESVAHFVELIRGGIAHRYLAPEIRFSDLSKIYALVSDEFDWPPISDKRLSMLLVSCGAQRFTRTKKHQKYKAFQFTIQPEAIREAA